MATTLIAWVTVERGISEYRKILTSDKDIFNLPTNLTASSEYNPGVLLDDDEWFEHANFSDKIYCLPLLCQSSFSSVNYNAITKADFGKIIFLCGYQNQYYFFQRVTPSRQVKQKKIVFGDLCEYEEDSASITLNNYADAIYNQLTNKLCFRKLRDISTIFDGIDELYREATKDEVRTFLDHNFIELANGFNSNNVKTNNRKRITQALEILDRFSENEKQTVFKYIKDYCLELENKNNKFVIRDEEMLKKLLFGIEQRYYTTPVGKERRLANSVIALTQNTNR